MTESLIAAEDDGLLTLEVGPWAEDKYTMVALYDRLFSTGMKGKWNSRIYIDLYSGPGFVRVKGSDRILRGSPLLALGVSDPFDKYILCETEQGYLEALRVRVARLFPGADVQFISGDCNEHIDDVCATITSAIQRKERVLSFCFLDPFDISIKFASVRKLAAFYIDFLFLLALHMDANRNLPHYLSPDNSKIDEFLGLPDWRERWRRLEPAGEFPKFLAEEYSRQMESLGYLPVPFYRMKQIRSDDRNLPLYRLALFSRDALAYKFWDEVLRYSTDQRSFESW